MVLLIGGAYQGKTAYAQKKYSLRHLERFALACVRTGKEPADVLGGLDLSEKILICEDISCGVVPMDAEAREWREAVGRMNAALAAQADTVTRIFCGLPLELKR